MKQSVLVIEDDTTLNRLICDQMEKIGLAATSVNNWKQANEYLTSSEPSLIITDVRLPDGNSLEFLPDLVDQQPVIVLTAYGSVRNAVDAIKAGATEYLVKPISPEELVIVVQRALDLAKLRNDHHFCRQMLASGTASMIGNSAALQEVRELVEAVADSDMTVLVHGESGTGKELVARAIHDSGKRAANNFVAVDCCTLQDKLFESELFGHEKGAFTSADRLKKGLIEGAAGGTLFLDEIGEIDTTIQAKLLRVLETGRFRRVGGTKDLVADVRIVAATNRDLEAMCAKGLFRSDLYYRLNAFSIITPPLRERREDIPMLAEHFIHNHNFSRRINKTLAPAAVRKLVAYDWPGNIRELKNVVERAIILSRDNPQIRPSHLAFSQSSISPESILTIGFDHDPTLEEMAARYLEMQLQKYSGRRAAVAEVLGVSERSVYRMIKRYKLSEEH